MFTLANVPKRYWEFKKPDGRTLHVEPPKLKVLCKLEELAKCETEQTTHLAECASRLLSKNREKVRITPEDVLEMMDTDQMMALFDDYMGWIRREKKSDPN